MTFRNSCRFTFVLLFFGVTLSLPAQHYTPFQEDSLLNEARIEQAVKRYERAIAGLHRKNDAAFIDFHTSRHELLTSELRSGAYYSDAAVYGYFNRILEHIYDSNPTIPSKDIRLYVSRSSTPNAACLGEGTLVFNLSLLQWLENESQVAFVLCHEIAHQTLEHTYKDIQKYIDFTESKATKQRIKEIEKSEFNQAEQITELYKDFLYTNRRYSRQQEVEADDIGLSYFKNTKYNLQEAVGCLERLDKINEGAEGVSVSVQEIFDLATYPFKSSWLEEEVSMFNEDIESESVFQKDSIKTHPDCTHRIQLLSPQIVDSAGHLFLQERTKFNQLKQSVSHEVAYRLYETGRLGHSLYHYLNLLKEHPNDAHIHAQIGGVFIEAYYGMKEHRFSYLVSLPNRNYDQDRRELLRMLHNMRSSEMKRLAYHYLKQYEDQFLKDEEYFMALYHATEIMNREEELEALRKQYSQLHPNGQYAELLEE